MGEVIASKLENKVIDGNHAACGVTNRGKQGHNWVILRGGAGTFLVGRMR